MTVSSEKGLSCRQRRWRRLGSVAFCACAAFFFSPDVTRADEPVYHLSQIRQFSARAGSTFSEFHAVGEKAFFTMDESHSVETGAAYGLWTSDGTVDGTFRLMGFSTTTGSPTIVRRLGDGVLLSEGSRLWRSDGTVAGSKLIFDNGASGIDIGNSAVVNNRLFFFNHNSAGNNLWSTDGTTDGTHMVKDFLPDEFGDEPLPTGLTAVGNRLVFSNQTVSVPYDNPERIDPELWVSDGTSGGTHELTDIYPGDTGSDPRSFRSLGERAVFMARDDVHGVELWGTDGTEAGTQLILDHAPGNDFGSNINPDGGKVIGSKLVFLQGSQLLWSTDGTVAGTGILRDFSPGTVPDPFAAVGTSAFFYGPSSGGGAALWATNGASAGTQPVPATEGIALFPPALIYGGGDTAFVYSAFNVVSAGTWDRRIYTTNGSTAPVAVSDWPVGQLAVVSADTSGGSFSNDGMLFIGETRTASPSTDTFALWKIAEEAPSVDTFINTEPGDPTNDRTPTFAFTATPEGGTFECRLYPQDATAPAFRACSGAGTDTSTEALAEGHYTFEVRATVNGLTDPTPAKRNFGVVWDKAPSFSCVSQADPCRRVEVEVKDLPSGDWKSITPDSHVYDGAELRLSLKSKNNRDFSKSNLNTQIFFTDQLSGRRIATVNLNQPYGEEVITRQVIDTSGWAWERNQPVTERTIGIEFQFSFTLENADIPGPVPIETTIKTDPRPIVAVHGLNSDATAWDGYGQLLRQFHPNWQAYAVGSGLYPNTEMDTNPFGGDTIAENASKEAEFVQRLRNDLDAPQVDLAVHSMGGLISRWYIDKMMPVEDGKPYVKHLLMHGTPNQGTICAEVGFSLMWWAAKKPSTTLAQLTSTYVGGIFNADITDQKGVEFSALAGYWAPHTCFVPGDSDGLVSIDSAFHIYSDRERVGSPDDPYFHVDLYNRANIINLFVLPRVNEDPTEVRADVLRSAGINSGQSSPTPSTLSDPGALASQSLNNAPPRLRGTTSELPGQMTVPAKFEVPPHASINYTFKVAQASRISATVMTDSSIGSELINPTGAVVSSIAPNTAEAGGLVRTLTQSSPVKGVWKVRLTSTSDSRQQAYVGVMVEGGRLDMAVRGSQNSQGEVSVFVTPTNHDQPVTDADVNVGVIDLKGGQADVELNDSGRGKDILADDGVYSGTTKAVAAGQAATASASAKIGDSIAIAQAVISQGTSSENCRLLGLEIKKAKKKLKNARSTLKKAKKTKVKKKRKGQIKRAKKKISKSNKALTQLKRKSC